MGCSLFSSSSNEIKWAVHYSIPVGNTKFNIRDMLGGFNKNALISIKDPDDSKSHTGDTIVINCARSDSNSYFSTIVNSSNLNNSFGADSITIHDLPVLKKTVPIKKSTTPYDIYDTIITSDFSNLKLSDNSKNPILTVKNSNGTLDGTPEIKLLDKNAQEILLEKVESSSDGSSFKIKSGTVPDTIIMVIHVDPSRFSNVDSLTLDIDLNGCLPTSGTIKSRFVSAPFSFSLSIPMEYKNFRCQYADVSKLSFDAHFTIPRGLMLESQATLPTVVPLADARTYPIESSQQLIDSKHSGSKRTITITGGSQVFQFNLDSSRIISDGASKIPLTLQGVISTKDSVVYIDSMRTVACKLDSLGIAFSRIHGRYTSDAFSEGSWKKLPLPFEANGSSKDELRNKFRLTNSNLMMEITYPLSDRTLIETMNYECIFALYNDNTVTYDTLRWRTDSISSSTNMKVTFPFEKIINAFPDSVRYRVNYTFPENRLIHLDDNVLENKDGICRVRFPVAYSVNLKTKVLWEFNDSTMIDLGVRKFSLKMPVKWSESIANKSITVNSGITNLTMFSGRVLAIGCARKDIEKLKLLTFDQIKSIIEKNSTPAPFVSLLSNQGITMPTHGVSHSQSYTISQPDMDSILSSDSLCVRFYLKGFPSTKNYLSDTDYIGIDLGIKIDGVQSTDILN